MADWVRSGEVSRAKQVTLDGSGNGTLNFDVGSANERWIIDAVLVSTDQAQTTAPYPQVTVYENGQQQAGLATGASWIGNQDVLKGRFVMDAGTDLLVAFTGGVAASKATAKITGRRELWR